MTDQEYEAAVKDFATKLQAKRLESFAALRAQSDAALKESRTMTEGVLAEVRALAGFPPATPAPQPQTGAPAQPATTPAAPG